MAALLREENINLREKVEESEKESERYHAHIQSTIAEEEKKFAAFKDALRNEIKVQINASVLVLLSYASFLIPRNVDFGHLFQNCPSLFFYNLKFLDATIALILPCQKRRHRGTCSNLKL